MIYLLLNIKNNYFHQATDSELYTRILKWNSWSRVTCRKTLINISLWLRQGRNSATLIIHKSIIKANRFTPTSSSPPRMRAYARVERETFKERTCHWNPFAWKFVRFFFLFGLLKWCKYFPFTLRNYFSEIPIVQNKDRALKS